MTILRRLIVSAAVLASAVAARGADQDQWYALEMFGGKVGWAHMTETDAPDRITTRSEMRLSLSRGDGASMLSMSGEFVESPQGKPISMKRVQKFGAGEVVQEFTFTEDHIDVKTIQQGRTTTATQPLPEGEWLTPAAADRFTLQRFKSGAKEITVRTLSTDSGATPVTVTRRDFTPDTLELNGRRIQATRCQTETSATPMAGTDWLDEDGNLVKSVTPLGEFSVVMTATTRELAQAAGTGPAPDVMAKTMIKPDKPIGNPRRVAKAVYLLSVAEGSLPDLPETGTQHVERLSPREARVTVTAREYAAAPKADADNAAYTRATTMCDSADDRVRALADKAVPKEGKALGEALRLVVYRHIKDKNMNVGYATASEVARHGAGDCSEHGVLLTALLRARGVPARAAAGLIYVEEFGGSKGVFGYHMWAQGLFDQDGAKRWIDLDGTLPSGMPYDATHITLDTSPLDDSDPSGGLIGVASVMGRLNIKVESLE